jgi:predicted flap endonuclease-1-like 5' DNA nuclease
MRRFGLIAASLAALLGLSLLWRKYLQRRRVIRQTTYAPASSSLWEAASPGTPGKRALVTTAESRRNQNDAGQEPAAPTPPQTEAVSPLSADTYPRNEPSLGPDTPSGSASEAEASPPDDLLRIEGIGPKVSTIVVAAGITTFAELANTDIARLQSILEEAGIHTTDPHTWPEQARLAAQGKWDELQELQDRIVNGQLEA